MDSFLSSHPAAWWVESVFFTIGVCIIFSLLSKNIEDLPPKETEEDEDHPSPFTAFLFFLLVSVIVAGYCALTWLAACFLKGRK